MNPINIIQYGRERYQEIVKWSAGYDKHEEHERKSQVRGINTSLTASMNRTHRTL